MENEKTTSPAPVSKTRKTVQETRQPPVCRVEFSGVSAAIWPKQIRSANGQPHDTWMVSLTRSYQDGKQTKRTHVLFPEHLLAASMALIKAWEFTENASQSEESDQA